jgi:hypothetical protein
MMDFDEGNCLTEGYSANVGYPKERRGRTTALLIGYGAVKG